MFRPTIAEDVMQMAPNVRGEDEREVQSITGLSAFTALSVGFFHSHTCTTGIGKSGNIVCISGVVPHRNGGSVWMISTPEITKNSREVLEVGREWLDDMNDKYGVLFNVVDDRNTLHKRLIKHMGFELGDTINNYGAAKIRVVPFTRIKQDV